jgi:hypothetical protein
MTSYLTELARGIFLAFGMALGFTGFLLLVAFTVKGKKSKLLAASDLLEPFKTYLKDCYRAERYEEISLVEEIVGVLEEGYVPDTVKLFEIKKDLAFHTEDLDKGSNIFRMVKTYEVVRKIKSK